MGVLRMKQVNRILSTYTADVSGVCSALYELGGMTIMHDASGCNSTYNTHDEPRWYDMPSMVYISALSEVEALMGDDSRLVEDVISAASQLHPRFIALCGTPIPRLMGTDLPGLARLIEKRTGIPAAGFSTSGTHSYLLGASKAMKWVAERFCKADLTPDRELSVNLLGVTPLDFSVTGTVEALRQLLTKNGIAVRSCWAMGSSWEELMEAGRAQVNLVLSSAGLETAKTLHSRYGTPWVTGIPMGEALQKKWLEAIRTAACTRENQYPFSPTKPNGRSALIIGEAVWASSMREALALTTGQSAQVLCPLELDGEALAPWDGRTTDENEIAARIREASLVIADPIYQHLCPPDIPFVRFPHEGYSGRIWRKEIPVFVGDDWDRWWQIACPAP